MTPEMEHNTILSTDIGLREKYKGNSHVSKTPSGVDDQTKVISKVVTGKVISREKTLGKKFAEMFCGEDVGSVGKYIIQDVLIPALKNTLSDIVTGGIEMMLFGELHRSGTRQGGYGQQSKTSYSSISNGRVDTRRAPLNISRPKNNLNEIILETRGEAEEVLSNLSDLIIDYGSASVAALYDMVGKDTSFTDNKYGWVDLRYSSVRRVRDGYLIDLPKTIALD